MLSLHKALGTSPGNMKKKIFSVGGSDGLDEEIG